jgi:hypothetical protein
MFFITSLRTRYWILIRWFFLEILDKKSLLVNANIQPFKKIGCSLLFCIFIEYVLQVVTKRVHLKLSLFELEVTPLAATFNAPNQTQKPLAAQ